MLSRLTGRRSLAGMVEVLRPAAAWLRDGPDAHDDDRALFQDFLDWTKVLLPQLEMPVRPDHAATLEWRELMDELTVIEARAREWPQEWLEEGRAKGIREGRAEGRALLCHLAARRFGATAGERLAAALADIRDPSRLRAVGDLVLDCATETELLAKLNGKPA